MTSNSDIASYALAAKILLAYEDARNGNPIPLIELQWGKVFRAADLLADPECIKKHVGRYLILDDCQFEIISSVCDPLIRETYVKGNTGCGKGFSIGIAVCLYFAMWEDAKVVLTRDSYDPAVKTLFGEVARWWKKMAHPPTRVELQTAALVHLDRREHSVSVVSPLRPEGFMGKHGEHVLFVFDEATASVLEDRFKQADTQCKKFLAAGNPRTTSGAFRRAFDGANDPNVTQTILGPYGRRRLITVDGKDILNVKAKRLSQPVAPSTGIEIRGKRYLHGETIPSEDFELVRELIPAQTCYDEFLGHCANPDPGWVRCMAHGQFPDSDPEKQIIDRKWLVRPKTIWRRFSDVRRRATERSGTFSRRLFDKLFPVDALGLDVGGSVDGDASILTVGGEKGIFAQHAAQFGDAPQLTDWVISSMMQSYGINITMGGLPICVDVDGIGWGVAGILRQRGCNVIEFRGNESSEHPKQYTNKRAEAYGELGRRLDPDERWKGIPFMIPDDEKLTGELCAPEKVFSRDGLQFSITPKRKVPGRENQAATVMDKIGRSPDRGDSAVYFYRALQVKGFDLGLWMDAGAF